MKMDPDIHWLWKSLSVCGVSILITRSYVCVPILTIPYFLSNFLLSQSVPLGRARVIWLLIVGTINIHILRKILVELDHCRRSCAQLRCENELKVRPTMDGLLNTWSIGKKSEKKRQVDFISLVMSCRRLQIHYISATRRCRIFQLTPTSEDKLWKVSTCTCLFLDHTSALCTSFCTLQNARVFTYTWVICGNCSAIYLWVWDWVSCI